METTWKKSKHLASRNEDKLCTYNSSLQIGPCISGLSIWPKKGEKKQDYKPWVFTSATDSNRALCKCPPPHSHCPSSACRSLLQELCNNIPNDFLLCILASCKSILYTDVRWNYFKVNLPMNILWLTNPSQPSHHLQDQVQAPSQGAWCPPEVGPNLPLLHFHPCQIWASPKALQSHLAKDPLCLVYTALLAEVLCPQFPPHPLVNTYSSTQGSSGRPFLRSLLCPLGRGRFPPLCSKTLWPISIVELITYIINFWLVPASHLPPHTSFLKPFEGTDCDSFILHMVGGMQ